MDKYENFNRFENLIHSLSNKLAPKYGILTYGFDVECIYETGDLTKLVKEMIDLGEFGAEFIKEGEDESKKQHYSIFKVSEVNYEFRTSSQGDYVDLDTIMPSLELIVKNNKPEYQYNFCNADGGQIAHLIFAQTIELIKAVDEGYPCSLPSSEWELNNTLKWSLYSCIEIDNIPNFQELKIRYFQTLTELYARGFNVPPLTINRIYIDDIFKSSSIDIIIDGASHAAYSSDIAANQIHCSRDNWGLLLAYTLIKHFGGKPALEFKFSNKKIR